MDVNHSFPIVMVLFMLFATLIAVFGNIFYIASFIPICSFGLIIYMVVIMAKCKPIHTCPVCLNTIGKTGTMVSW